MRDTLQDALQRLVSPRSSSDARTEALNTLERLLAAVVVPRTAACQLFDFLSFQDTFECNISSHMLAWIAASIPRLEHLTSKSSTEHERESEVATLSAQISTGLSILQGMVLNHGPSKRYLGRKYALEVMIDLLLVSRHLAPLPLSTITNSSAKSTAGTVDLTSVVLDTILCVLVDSSCALRCFEDANGVPAVVKILKRAGTPRQVRMKCLEFLYFYLLDESPPSDDRLSDSDSESSWPSSSFSSPRSSSWGSISSFSTEASTTTCNTSSSPVKRPQLRSLMMLQKEVEFVPISPKKAQIARVGERTEDGEPRRTTAEKMAILGGLLGNVEALVDGVRRAGVFGLG